LLVGRSNGFGLQRNLTELLVQQQQKQQQQQQSSQQQLPSHPDVKYKHLPFYDLLGEIMRPTSLGTTYIRPLLIIFIEVKRPFLNLKTNLLKHLLNLKYEIHFVFIAYFYIPKNICTHFLPPFCYLLY